MANVTRRNVGLMLAGAIMGVVMIPALSYAASPADEVVIGIQGSSLIKLDPGTADQVRGELSAVRAIYSALTQIASDGSIKPDVAVSWKQIDDLTWEFELRDDVAFTSGVKLTAKDVVFSLMRLKNPENKFPTTTTNQLDRIASAEVVDDHTVRFVTNGPFFELPARLSNVFIMEGGWTAQNNPATAAMGSGPYKLDTFLRDEKVTLVVNEDYYGQVPAVKKFTFRSFGNAATKRAAFEAGEIHASAPIDPSDIEQFKAMGFEIAGMGSNRTHYLRINFMDGPLGDVRVRKALNLAINRQLITDTIYYGMVSPSASQPISPAYADYQADFEPFPYDPAQAKALLTEAGYPDGFEVVLSIPSGIYVGADDASQVIMAQLAEVGVKVRVESIPMATWLDQISKESAPGLTYYGSKSNSNIANEVLTQLTRKTSHTHGTDEQLAEFEAAVSLARAAKSEAEKDAATRRALEIARDNVLAVFLWPQIALFAHNKALVWPARADDVVSPQDITYAAK